MNIAGAKWLRGASYLTDADREKVWAAVERCRRAYPGERVKIRCASYIGEPSPFAVVVYGPGERIFESVYR